MRKPPEAGQRGVSLVVSLIMLVAVLILGTSAAQLALQSEKASRNDRDRQIAFQAAEAALMDAELDIENSPASSASRSKLFSKGSALGFPTEGEDVCHAASAGKHHGLCRRTPDGTAPAWQSVDFADDAASSARSVPYGKFTGQSFPAGQGPLPGKLPRYIVELMPYHKQGEGVDQAGYFYRITAIGFGPRETTQVLLQTFYRKEN